jgi:ribosomal protein L24
LGILEGLGIVKSEYVMLLEPELKGKVGKVYSINRKRLKETLDALQQRLPKLAPDNYMSGL